MKKFVNNISKCLFSVIIFLFIASLCVIDFAYGDININLVVVNPSEEETKEQPITYYLPDELEEEDIIDANGLEVKYDIDKSSYYLSGNFELKPKETRTIKVKVKDVWQVSQIEIDLLRNQIDENLSLLEGTDYYETAKILRDDMIRKLDYIVGQQKNYSENIERRIDEYRAHEEILKKIRKQAFSIEYLRTAPTHQMVETETVKFVIEVTNPSDDKKRTVSHKHYLPAEVLSEHIIDKQGFTVRFDKERQQSYLSKEEVFDPGETKRYEIVIKDIWSVPIERADELRKKAESAFAEIKGSEFEQSAGFLLEKVNEILERIEASIVGKEDMAKYIAMFRANQRRFNEVEGDIEMLDKMLAIVKAKKLEEFEKSKVTNVLQKIKALRGIMAISQAIFGKKLSMNTTWKVIWGILIFVALFTTIHFFAWFRRSAVMGEEIAIKSGGGGEITEVSSEPEEEKEKKT